MKNQIKGVMIAAIMLVCVSCNTTKLQTAEMEKDPKEIEISQTSTIVCFGDSLTYGHGADSATESWPARLQERVNIPVINSGLDDNTTAEAVLRFKQDVLDYNPSVIIFDFGGNDRFLPKKFQTYRQIENNFRTMLNQIDFETTQVYLMRFYNDEMRFLDIFCQFDRLLQRLEKDYDVVVIWDAWKGAWGHKDCKFDMSHCNAKGYGIMEANIYEVMEPFLRKNNLLQKQ